MEEGKDGRLGGWEMQVAECKGRQGTGDGRKAGRRRFRHLFLNCFLNFLFFEEQLPSAED
jgi:hypothetical protein